MIAASSVGETACNTCDEQCGGAQLCQFHSYSLQTHCGTHSGLGNMSVRTSFFTLRGSAAQCEAQWQLARSAHHVRTTSVLTLRNCLAVY